jgi:hypothetical protein
VAMCVRVMAHLSEEMHVDFSRVCVEIIDWGVKLRGGLSSTKVCLVGCSST